MVQHQDKSKNARLKSEEAAFAAWLEELRADQTQFVAEKVLRPSCNISGTAIWCQCNLIWIFWKPIGTIKFVECLPKDLPVLSPPSFPQGREGGCKN